MRQFVQEKAVTVLECVGVYSSHASSTNESSSIARYSKQVVGLLLCKWNSQSLHKVDESLQ